MRALSSPRTIFVAAFAASAAAGCLLTTDLGGLAGDPSASPSEEAATVPHPTDGGPDTAARADAATDAPVDGSSTSPCKAAHAFCGDFDLDEPAFGWTTTEASSPAGSIVFDPLAVSAPRSMRARHPRKSAPAQWFNALHKKFEMAWRRAVVAGDVYSEAPAWQAGDSNFSTVAVLMNSTSQNTGTVFFFAETDAAATIEHLPDSPARYMGVDRLPYGAWTHVVLDFDPSGHVRYTIGGKAFDRDFAAAVPGDNPFLDIEIGAINFNSPVPAMDVRWDNVTIDFP